MICDTLYGSWNHFTSPVQQPSLTNHSQSHEKLYWMYKKLHMFDIKRWENTQFSHQSYWFFIMLPESSLSFDFMLFNYLLFFINTSVQKCQCLGVICVTFIQHKFWWNPVSQSRILFWRERKKDKKERERRQWGGQNGPCCICKSCNVSMV